MRTRGNPGCLIVALGGLLSLVSTAFGAHIYRWEMITWPALAVIMSLLAYAYSRNTE